MLAMYKYEHNKFTNNVNKFNSILLQEMCALNGTELDLVHHDIVYGAV